MNNDVNVYLKLEERDFNNGHEETMVGFFGDIIVPTKGENGFGLKDYEIIEKMRKSNKFIESIHIENGKVLFKCYFDKGDYVNSIEELYKYSRELEDKVGKVMSEVGIREYTLVIHVSTC